MDPTTVVIVGAGVAGLRTAEAIRRHHPHVRITLVGEEEHAPYQRPPLSKELLTATDDPAEPVALAHTLPLDDPMVDLHLGVRVVAVDALHHTVTLADGSALRWDKLVIATGRQASCPAVWQQVPGVHTLRTFTDLSQLRTAFATAHSVAVIGAGVLGCEVAAAARRRGLQVHLIDAAEQPMMRMLGPELGAFAAAVHEENGVQLHLQTSVTGLSDGPQVRLSNGEVLTPDVVVVAVGATTDLSWLAASGLELADGVVVDATQATNVPDIFAVGDVAVQPDPVHPEHLIRNEHWTYAVDSAEVAAANLFADEPVPNTALPYAWSDQWKLKFQTLGRVVGAPILARGSYADRAFLALFAENGVVVGAAACNHVPHLMKTRTAIAQSHAVSDVLDRFCDASSSLASR